MNKYMKLSDIFKLDLNTGGGNKLFARIMNKYNVPKKEYENVKQEMNSFSGGGDSGSSDVEYWKFNHFLNTNDADTYAVTVASTIKGVNGNNMISIITLYLQNNYRETGNPLELNTISAFSYLPVSLDGTLRSFTDFANFILENENINILERVTPITKEEFYDLNNI